MGFLTGTYLKMQTARMRIQLQHQLTSVMSQLNRVTKQMGQMEKMLTSQQRSADLALRQQTQASIWGTLQQKYPGVDPNNPTTLTGLDSAAMQAFSTVQQQMQYRYAQAQSVWADYFENYKEAQLEPLKSLEESLTIKKTNIESRIALIGEQEKAANDMIKSSQQDFTPQYSGQG